MSSLTFSKSKAHIDRQNATEQIQNNKTNKNKGMLNYLIPY